MASYENGKLMAFIREGNTKSLAGQLIFMSGQFAFLHRTVR